MKNDFIFFIILFFILLTQTAYAQQSVVNDVQHQQDIITSAQSSINFCNATITNANATIATAQSAISEDNTLIAVYNAANAQNASQVNWDEMDLLEIGGYQWADIPALTPGVNWTNIVPQLNITCAVAQNQVNWYAWPQCEADGTNWSTFYCDKGVGC